MALFIAAVTCLAGGFMMAAGGWPPGPRLALKFSHEDGQLQLFRTLFSFLLPKFSLASLERGHFLLRQWHEIVAQRLG
jgi:hypothetical protein